MLEIKHYRLVRALVEEGTISGAARALGYSQPAVTQQLRALEKSVIGGPVVARLNGRLRATQLGEVILRHGARIESLVDLTASEVASVQSVDSGRVRIASFTSAAAAIVPRAMRSLRDRMPGVLFSFIEAKTERALELVSSGEVDLALIALDLNDLHLVDDELEWCALFTERMRLIGGSRSLPASSLPLPLIELRDASWIVGCPTCRQSVIAACAEAGFQPRIEFETDDYTALQSLAVAEFGVALVPELTLSITGEMEGLSLRDPEPPQYRTVYAVGSGGMLAMPATAAMLECLRMICKEFTVSVSSAAQQHR